MKRPILASLMLIVAVAAVSFCTRQKATTEEGLLKGAWSVTHISRDGDLQKAQGYEIMFGDDAFVATASFRHASAGTYSVDGGRQPKLIDMELVEDSSDRTLFLRGIYTASEDDGKLCFVSSNAYPRPRVFSTSKGDGQTLLILKRLTDREWEIDGVLPKGP